MPCPVCGEFCGCALEDEDKEHDRSNALPRWLPDTEASAHAIASPAPHPQPGILAQPAPAAGDAGAAGACSTPTVEQPCAWRLEVAARLNRYQSRRKPRPPRYPSLRLRFEPEVSRVLDQFSSEPISSDQGPSEQAATSATEFTPQRYPASISNQALALDEFANHSEPAESSRLEPARTTGPRIQEGTSALTFQVEPLSDENPLPAIPAAPTGAKILEFPRSWTPPVAPINELAEPVQVRPRILEAPEVVPPPPALGGIMIEPAEPPKPEKRPGVDNPLCGTPVLRRVGSALIDDFIVILACALFAGIFWKLAGVRPPRIQLLGLATGISALFWAAYQYLLVVYAGTTPGLRLARLELTRFDGAPVSRGLRRWRVLASFLSAASLGMGYAWVFLDEDSLCWHDRITHTYFAPKSNTSSEEI
jgi:uncharacterized RDD family membrane protein YckC